MYKKIAKRFLIASLVSYDLNSSVPDSVLEVARKDTYLEGYVNKQRSRPILLGDEVIGFIAPRKSSDGVWRLKSIFVLPDFRGQGVARQVIKDFFKSRPGRAFINNSNISSQKAFKAAGFVPYMEEDRWDGGKWWANKKGLAIMGEEVL